MGVVTSGTYLESELTAGLSSRVERELGGHARFLQRQLQDRAADGDATALRALVQALADAAGVRVSLISRQGRVILDTRVAPTALPGLDDHRTRPEVRAALGGGTGVARRASSTVGAEMLYVALPYPDGVVRVARPLRELDDAVLHLRALLVFAGLVGLAVAAFMSFLSTHLLSETIRSLVDRAAESADGRARFQAVLEGMEEAVLALDEAGRVELANRAATRLLGLKEPPVGRHVDEILPGPEARDLLRAGPAGETTELLLDRDGRRRVLARLTPYRTSRAAPETPGGRVLVMHDVTELRRLETQRQDFVANVSHELRTPLSVLRVNLETLQDGCYQDEDEAQELMDTSLRHVERLSRLVADLLEISRLEVGKYPLEIEPVRILPLVEEARAAAAASADQVGGGSPPIRIDLDEDLEVAADVRAMEQILTNLLENAAKYTPVGGSIRIEAERSDASVMIRIVDDGPGVAPEHRPRVFERFYRVDPGRSREVGGTGLGLSIVKHLVLAMRGEVGVEANRPRGSIFWFRLPTPDRANVAAA